MRALAGVLLAAVVFGGCGKPSGGAPTSETASAGGGKVSTRKDILRDIVQLEAVRYDSFCALNEAGEVYCWGGNKLDDDGPEGAFVRPRRVRDLPPVREIATVTIALARNGDIYEWWYGPNASSLRATRSDLPPAPTGHFIDGGDIVEDDHFRRSSTGEMSADELAGKVTTFKGELLGAMRVEEANNGESSYDCYVFASGRVDCSTRDPFQRWGELVSFRLPAHAVSIGGHGGHDGFVVGLVTGRTATWGPDLEVFIRLGVPPVHKPEQEGSETCGLTALDEVICWRPDGYGRFFEEVDQPSVVPNAGPAKQIAMQDMTTCALQLDGTVKCWGHNNDGECAQGTRSEWIKTPAYVLAPRE